MVEKLQADSEKSLEVHKDEVIKALAGETGGATSPDDNPLATEAMTHAVGGSAFAVAMAVREDLSATNKNNSNSMFVGGGPKGNANSLFVGGGGSKATHTSVPLVPISKTAKNDAIVSRAGITSMSLTGSSSTGGKPTPIKNANISEKTAKTLRIAELQQELNVVNQEMGKSLDEGSKRTMEAAKKGDDRAKRAIARSSRNAGAPKTPTSPPMPSGQKSS
ncbi:MAG: hypothetical protein K8R48_03400 [Alphaproteobacteria bacterium]|nr:hypothetical protein [Alphaproteobacteria bacterium]